MEISLIHLREIGDSELDGNVSEFCSYLFLYVRLRIVHTKKVEISMIYSRKIGDSELDGNVRELRGPFESDVGEDKHGVCVRGYEAVGLLANHWKHGNMHVYVKIMEMLYLVGFQIQVLTLNMFTK